jgi:lipoprotein-anchoring transpeptidase ErfK/SrfK
VIAPGVHVGSMAVGGLLAVPARDAITAELARPVSVEFAGKTTRVAPRRLGARVDVNAAIAAALAATPRSSISVPVRTSPSRVAAVVAGLAKAYDRAPVAAKVTGATDNGPVFVPARPGRAVDQKTMRAALAQAVALGRRVPLQLITMPVPAKRTLAHFGPVIVITRGENKLRLFDGKRLVRVFSVATGQAIYPTPAGIWFIKDKQKNPWWYPPTYDAWAKGLKPVPPGPTNPLGTRWMGLNAPGVGIHGTDAPSSIGYSASHGCIRMQVPDAEWLFPRVRVGTPVVIL